MAVTMDTYAPFDAGAGANSMEATWRSFMSQFPSGVLRGRNNDMQCYADSTGMQVKVKTGECWVRGHWGQITSEKTLAIASAHASLTRIDRCVARADFSNNRVEVDILTGIAGSGTFVGLTQNTSIWEIPLAIITVPATDTSIDASQVQDQRLYTGDRLARGVVGMVKQATSNSGVNAETMMESVTFGAESGRYYEVSFESNHDTSNPTFRFRYATGTSVTTSGTLIRDSNVEGSGASRLFKMTGIFVAPTTDTYTIGVSAQGSGLNVTSSAATQRLFLVKDIGLL
ncbi:hypothetical protein C8D88_116150 [Lentzea atacamensis]|uniref:Uncharacterized protein n=1 Tax=Lentzea atacamensis TaxID=531938 RepID=A0A316HP00_9PSEU|nr:hypothetical protein [Lentzea atacamensis]PWK81738.1 hypothetical protein C8D88_116150 [Lentzea atacamensis]